jgi:stage II sporulation protein AA (anti-sigma F factor antagonist)
MSGEIDHHWAEYLRDKVDYEIMKSKTRDVVFDFGNVSFMDSSGIGALMGRFKNIKSINGKVCAVNLNNHVSKIFLMSGLTRIIPVYENIECAITKLQEVAI